MTLVPVAFCVLSAGKESNESLGVPGGHSRNHSDGSFSNRVILGRESTPTFNGNANANGPTRIPRELWEKFEGKSREVRIHLVYWFRDEIESLNGIFLGLDRGDCSHAVQDRGAGEEVGRP